MAQLQPNSDVKYTDRDVRENPDLTELALEYLSRYGGDFDFLVEAKHRLAEDCSLPVPIIRGVLNCMRVDSRWRRNMPDPLAPTAEVVSIDSRRKPRVQRKDQSCENIESHDAHTWRDDDERFILTCRGVPFSIHRAHRVETPVKVRARNPFAKARHGRLAHLVRPEGHIAYWGVRNVHAEGPRYLQMLWIEVYCKTKWVRNGFLMTPDQVDSLIDLDSRFTYCLNCVSIAEEETS